jgi:UDP-glucose 4-epimerase
MTRNKSAIVTGGAGFIGSTLVDRLLAEGYQVTVIDDFSSGRPSNLEAAQANNGDNLEVVELDIRLLAASDLIADLKPEVIFHLAAQVDVRHSVSDPVFDAEVNILGTLRVLEGARRGGLSKVVAAVSGGTLYGEPDPTHLPLGESLPSDPRSPYGVSKLATGHYLTAYRHLHGVDGTALALANVYGPRQDPHGEAGVVAIFAGRLLAGEPCTVFGTGAQTRDFVYVDDVVDAFVQATAVTEVDLCNIGTGVETSVTELYQAMALAAEGPAEPLVAPARLGELDRSCLDPESAFKLFGWQATTSLERGVIQTLYWFRKCSDERQQ